MSTEQSKFAMMKKNSIHVKREPKLKYASFKKIDKMCLMHLLKKKISTEHNAKDGPRIVEHGILNCGVLHRKTSSPGQKRED